MSCVNRFTVSFNSIQKNICLGIFILLAALALAGCKAAYEPQVKPADCPFTKDSRYKTECGELSVPENRAKRSTPLIELPYAIVRSNDPEKHTDPVVVLHGGPGGYALNMMDYWTSIHGLTLEHRDLIVFDQRGAGYSKPSLNCPELEEPYFQSYANDLDSQEDLEVYIQGLQLCHDRLVEQGVDLSAYTSAANAADLEDLRKALGYEKWNLYGSSYGTRLALTAMRDFPEGIRSVLLDSVYPLAGDLFVETEANMQRSLDLLFERCAADPECSRGYPDLEQDFYALVDRLDAEPVTLELDHKSVKYPFVLNGDRFISYFFDMLYWTDELASLPSYLYEIKQGKWENFKRMLSWTVFNSDHFSEGMYRSIECAEEAAFGSPEQVEQAAAQVNPRLSQAMNMKGFYDQCEIWKVKPARAIENQPVSSDIPTLILAGEHDPVTPPAWGRLAAETLSRAQYLEFPGASHGVLGFMSFKGETCLSTRIVQDFYTSPETPLEASCVSKIPVLFAKDN